MGPASWAPLLAEWGPKCLRVERSEEGAGGASAVSQRAMFLVGDSHAAMAVDGLQRAVAGEFKLVWFAVGGGCSLTRYGCKGEKCAPGGERAYRCGSYPTTVLAALSSQLRRGDVVVVLNWGEHHDEFTATWVPEPHKVPPDPNASRAHKRPSHLNAL